jgi:hypothetical protein
MTTPLEVITEALREITVLARNQSPNAQQGVQGLARLNSMVADWELHAISVGSPNWTLSQTIPLPANHIDALMFNLALRLAPSYGKVPNPVTVEGATRGERALQAAYGDPIDMTIDSGFMNPNSRFPSGRSF